MIRKTFALVAALALCLTLAPASYATDTYEVDNVHSSVGFKIRHLVSKTAGRFSDFSGNIAVDPADLTRSSVEFNIVAASIDTDNEKRNGHLKSPDFFDVEKYPSITFKSSKIEKTAENKYSVTGDFTMHGVTKAITIPVEVLGLGGGMAGFETGFTINRKDYGILWNKGLDTGGFLLGDDVDVSITIESNQKQAE